MAISHYIDIFKTILTIYRNKKSIDNILLDDITSEIVQLDYLQHLLAALKINLAFDKTDTDLTLTVAFDCAVAGSSIQFNFFEFN